MRYALGRKPRAFNPLIPHMSALKQMPHIRSSFTEGQSIPPSDWTMKLPTQLGVMLNDDLGDCTCAGAYHLIQTWSSQCNPDGLVITEPDGDVLKMYEAVGGYVPGDSSTDNGAAEQDVLAYWLRTGIPTGPEGATRHLLRGLFEIDPRNQEDVRIAINECGGVYIGITVPNYILTGPPTVWDYPAPPGGNPSIAGRHCVILVGQNPHEFIFVSWGQIFRMTNAFFGALTDEAYALVDNDWVTSKGTTPLGLSLDELDALMAPLKGAPPANYAPPGGA
jgi:hypothetical protein